MAFASYSSLIAELCRRQGRDSARELVHVDGNSLSESEVHACVRRSVTSDRGLPGGVLLGRVLPDDGVPAVRHHAEPRRRGLHGRRPHRRRHSR